MISLTLWRLVGGAVGLGLFWWLFNLGGVHHLQNWLLETAWSRTISGEQRVAPWPWANTWPVARLWLPTHSSRHVVLAGANDETLSVGIGHISHSTKPGDIGNAILSVPAMPHFDIMKTLQSGQRLILELPFKGRWHYQVQAVYWIDKADTRLLSPSLERRLTLIIEDQKESDKRYVVVADAVRQSIDEVTAAGPIQSFGVPALR